MVARALCHRVKYFEFSGSIFNLKSKLLITLNSNSMVGAIGLSATFFFNACH